ncbi:hypothetical protein CROQUDRAFT_664356 [Cronartium quercuum f. sp. fusiforme G11]|uniref:Uncharacterized protein n=1 Tax=Cronartium quercuum f. sp. fusiforme G11 TaxID=708437 RepID=A0A9P6T829_9BASI|nr:hypothetical protein CROQUDRAFT_664356 [Cronartium quercuum f. sp. fusiforme G11]
MSTLIEISPSPGAHPVPSHSSAQWARSPDACMTPTTLPTGLVRMADPMSLTPSPGSSSSSGPVRTLPYAIVIGQPDHPLSDGSEHGFSSIGSRPASGSAQDQDEAGGDDKDSENNIHEPAQQNSSPLDDLQPANVLHAFNFSRITTDQLAEQPPTLASPSPSSLATNPATNRPRVAGPGRTQHPLDPIPGAPPPALQKAKGPWHKAEDAALMYWVSHLGTGKWVDIARRVGSRTGKQCRERWTNQLSPDIDHSAFRHEEDLIIITMQQTLQANKWCEVAKFLPGRPENAIK